MSKLKLFLFSILVFSCIYTSAQENKHILSDTVWTYAIKGYPSEIPLIDEHSIFTGADASPLVCLDKFTGKEKWKLTGRYDRGFIHTVKDDKNGNIYFNGMRNNIFSVQKSDGKHRWTYNCTFDDDIFSCITIEDKVLFINPAERDFLALSTDGELLWKRTLPDICLAYSIEKDRIYCQLKNGVYILNKANGNVQTTIMNDSVLTNRFPFPPVSIKNLLIVQRNDSIFCHDKNDKFRILWTLKNMNALYYEHNSLYTYNDTLFQKVDARSGELLWTLKSDFRWYIQPALHKSILYLQTRYNFYIIDNETGKVYLHSPFRFKSYTKPVIQDDKIYLGFGGKYLCIKNPVVTK